MRHKSRHTQVE